MSKLHLDAGGIAKHVFDVKSNSIYTTNINSLVREKFDSIKVGYPDGKTETFSYFHHEHLVAMVIVSYTDESKDYLAEVKLGKKSNV